MNYELILNYKNAYFPLNRILASSHLPLPSSFSSSPFFFHLVFGFPIYIPHPSSFLGLGLLFFSFFFLLFLLLAPPHRSSSIHMPSCLSFFLDRPQSNGCLVKDARKYNTIAVF